ncbi:helix-turn-helix transcriptional regulator [Embleya sp. NPDC001921]
MRRRDNGQPIRDAMKDAGLTIPDLAKATVEIDGYGISQATVGAYVATGTSGREKPRKRTADLIAAVLHRPVDEFFDAT